MAQELIKIANENRTHTSKKQIQSKNELHIEIQTETNCKPLTKNLPLREFYFQKIIIYRCMYLKSYTSIFR